MKSATDFWILQLKLGFIDYVIKRLFFELSYIVFFVLMKFLFVFVVSSVCPGMLSAFSVIKCTFLRTLRMHACVCVNGLPLAVIDRLLEGLNHLGPVSSASLLLLAPS